MVHVETDCSQFTVAKLSWLKDAVYTYTLAVSNDKKDFMAYLRRVTIACSLQTGYFKGRVDQNDIKCDGIRRTQADFMLNKQMICFYYVKFNNNSVILRLDNDSDYYVPHYNHECGVKRDDDCMTCAWTADGYINYFKRCSSANRCSGLYQFHDRRHAQNLTTTAAATAAVPLRCGNARERPVGRTGFGPVDRRHGGTRHRQEPPDTDREEIDDGDSGRARVRQPEAGGQ